MEPILSIVVAIVSDTTGPGGTAHLEGCLGALERQAHAPQMEILVPYDARIASMAEFARRFPAVRFIRVEEFRGASPPRRGSREHHDELRGIGIRHARAPLVALLEDHGHAGARWCAALVKEHEQPYAAVGGAMENGVDRPLNWAVYFGDFGRYQNPVPRGPSATVSDANVCYKRAALERVADAWAESYSEARVHAALAERGETLALSPDVIVYQHRLDLRLGPALEERRVWGRSFAAARAEHMTLLCRAVYAALTPALPAALLARQCRNIVRTKRNLGAFAKALPLTALLDLAWSWGEFLGYVTGVT